jgi:uncharacterized protein (DUF983 family)
MPDLEESDRRHQIRAMMNGARGTCPRCGKGRLFSRYLSTQDHCPECNEELSHHRADDFPAYLNIFIVGHVVVGLMMVAMNWLIMPMWALVFVTAGIATACSVLLMRPLKGIVIGAQWALRMHGFGGNDD